MNDDKELKAVLHDLQNHQVELEIQNEELRQTQEQLESLQLRYSRLFEYAPIGYVILNPSGIILQNNIRFDEMMTADSGTLQGKAFASFMCHEDEPIFRARFRSFFKNPGGKGIEVTFRKIGKGSFYAHLAALPHQSIKNFQNREIHDNDELLITITDISIRKKAEEAREKALNEQERLFQELQHRAKNSFSMITNLIALKSSQELQEETQEVLNDLLGRVKAISELYTLLYQGGTIDQVNLDDYCLRILKSLTQMAPQVILEHTIEPVVFPVKEAASVGLIVTELVSNALKYAFSPEIPGTIYFSLKNKEEEIELVVRDNGKGMPESPPKATEGSGLGLTLVNALTDSLNGELRVSSEGGTAFTIRIPLPSQ